MDEGCVCRLRGKKRAGENCIVRTLLFAFYLPSLWFSPRHWRHGLRTKEAISAKREARELLRAVRDFLTQNPH
jgi:hypothetical protein